MGQTSDSHHCDGPALGWYCSRHKGHPGPCAAWYVGDDDPRLVKARLDRKAAQRATPVHAAIALITLAVLAAAGSAALVVFVRFVHALAK